LLIPISSPEKSDQEQFLVANAQLVAGATKITKTWHQPAAFPSYCPSNKNTHLRAHSFPAENSRSMFVMLI